VIPGIVTPMRHLEQDATVDDTVEVPLQARDMPVDQ
jgi:hypothetical protein